MKQLTPASGTSWIAAGLMLGIVSLAAPSSAATANTLSGEILGQVKNVAGVAQMGANVYLYNRYGAPARKGRSSE